MDIAQVFAARLQARIIGQQGPDTREDSRTAGPPAMSVAARLGRGDPLAYPVRQRGPAIQAGGQLDAYPWPPAFPA